MFMEQSDRRMKRASHAFEVVKKNAKKKRKEIAADIECGVRSFLQSLKLSLLLGFSNKESCLKLKADFF